jgi:AsmA protein
LQGTFASDAIDLTRYSRISAPESPPASKWLDAGIDFALLERLDVDFRLSAKRIQLENTEFSRVALAAAVKAGRLTLAVGEAQVFGGTLRGTAAFARGEAGMEVKIDAGLAAFNVESGLAELAGIRRLDGTGTLNVALESIGTNFGALLRDLSGKASLVVTAGTITGINVEQVLRRLDRKPLSSFADLRGGRTPFDRFAVTMRIAGGVATLDEIKIESALVRVTLTGTASLARRDFDLRGTASLVRPASVTTGPRGLDLPFLLRGPWDSPLLQPDVEALIEHSGAVVPLLDAVRGKTTRGTVRSVIESLTGRQPETPAPTTPPPATPR